MSERDQDLVSMYFRDQRAEAEKVAETVLESAVYKGIEQGRKRQVRNRKIYIFAAVAAAFLLLFVTVTAVESMDQRAELAKLQPKDWKELEVFRSVVENNITLKTALDAGYVHHFENAVAESNGYRLTINGAVADRKGLLLLYTFENETGQKVLLDGVQLKDKTGGNLKYGLYSSYSPGDSEYTAIKRNWFEIRWGDDVSKELEEQITVELIVTEDTPEAMLSSSTKYRTSLQVPITLDESALRTAGEEIIVDKKIIVAGQSVIVKKVFIAPTGTYINIQNDPANTLNIFNLIEPKVTQGEGEHSIELGSTLSFGNLNNETTLLFDHNNMDMEGPIELSVKGIHALEKSMLKLIIDTEKMEILQGPDNNIVVTREPDMSSMQFILKYSRKKLSKNINYVEFMNSVSLGNTFTDGAGNSYDLDMSGGEMRTDSEGFSNMYYFDVGTEKLTQPLTFNLQSYPNPILDAQSLQIR